MRMLAGEITPKELSNDDDELYFSQKTRDNIKKIQMEYASFDHVRLI